MTAPGRCPHGVSGRPCVACYLAHGPKGQPLRWYAPHPTFLPFDPDPLTVTGDDPWTRRAPVAPAGIELDRRGWGYRVPAWVHMAEVPLPADDEPWQPDEEPWWPDGDPAHVTPVGCWLLASFGLLALFVFVVWRLLR